MLFFVEYTWKKEQGSFCKNRIYKKTFSEKIPENAVTTFLPPFGYILKQTPTDMPCTPVSMIETQNFNPTSPENVNNAVINKHTNKTWLSTL